MKLFKKVHNAIITLFMALFCLVILVFSLIAMVIRFDGFGTIKELRSIWLETIRALWKNKK